MESMEEIYSSYSKNVYLFLLSKTCNHNLAEELTQETFFCAINSINNFKGNSSILTWLCGIAQNVWYKYLRNHKTELELSSCGDTISATSAENEVLADWENVEVLKSLHKLKEPIKEVMYLRLIGDVSFAQIGEIMGKSENWARVNFYRGKKKIIEEMKNNE